MRTTTTDAKMMMELEKKSQIGGRSFDDIPADQEDSYITAAAAYRGESRETIMAALEAGKWVEYGTDWYERLRMKPHPRPVPPAEMVACSCGHVVTRLQVMTASLGTACPDCYDRMSG